MEIYDLIEAVSELPDIVERGFSSSELKTTYKDDGSPVTNVDLQIHDLLLRWLQEKHPDIGYIGEEGNSFRPDQKKVLYVDPLDGTRAYEHGAADVSVPLSIMELREDGLWYPSMSIIHDPFFDQTWVAEHGRATQIWEDELKIREDGTFTIRTLSAKPSFDHLKVNLVSWSGAPYDLSNLKSVLEEDGHLERLGSLALGGGLIASGEMGASIFAGGTAVETAAMTLVVRGAGGVATDLFGNELGGYNLVEMNGKLDFLLSKGAIISACREINDQLVDMVKPYLT